MDDRHFSALMAEADAYTAELRANLQKMRPGLLRIRANYVAFIEAIEKCPTGILSWAPPLGDGTYASLPAAIEKECSAAILRVLRKHVAKCDKGLGLKGGAA